MADSEPLICMYIDDVFGSPSGAIKIGELAGREVCFLPRHGRGHRVLPSDLPFQANILAMKQLGVEWIISSSAVGSMKEEIEPGHMVIPSQFIDRTMHRRSTFFGKGCVAHISFADPVCGSLSGIVAQVIETVGKNVAIAKKIVETSVPRIPETRECGCASAMQYGIMTAPEAIPAATREKLKDIIGKYIS